MRRKKRPTQGAFQSRSTNKPQPQPPQDSRFKKQEALANKEDRFKKLEEICSKHPVHHAVCFLALQRLNYYIYRKTNSARDDHIFDRLNMELSEITTNLPDKDYEDYINEIMADSDLLMAIHDAICDARVYISLDTKGNWAQKFSTTDRVPRPTNLVSSIFFAVACHGNFTSSARHLRDVYAVLELADIEAMEGLKRLLKKSLVETGKLDVAEGAYTLQ